MTSKTVEEGGKHTPYGEDGSGFYTDNTKGCFDVIAKAIPVCEDLALKTMEARPADRKNDTFVIADYGTADGGTSLNLMMAIIKKLRSVYPKLPVMVQYEDQPNNDFKSLFLRLQKLIPGPESYFAELDNVYVTACGTSFYEQCFPPSSVDLGFCATAMHWLSHTPCKLGKVLHSAMSEGEDREAFEKQACGDWTSILLKRAAEMKSGGHMVVINFAIDDEGQYLGNSKFVSENMHANFCKIWRTLVDDGTITEDEFVNTTFPNQYRRMAEIRKPFEAAADGALAGLTLVSSEAMVTRCPYNEQFVKGECEGMDGAAYAKWFMPTTRTWSNGTFLAGLDNGRTEDAKKAIVDRFFSLYEAKIASSPKDHAMDYVHSLSIMRQA